MPTALVTGYVLAGGQSSRMGQDKALLPVAGEPLVQHALRTLAGVCGEVAVLSGPPHPARERALAQFGRLVPDAGVAHRGPLAGVAAALADCRTPFALLVAVDQPALTPGILERLAGCEAADPAIACCDIDGRPEPLPVLVARRLLPELEELLRRGERKLLPTLLRCAADRGEACLRIPESSAESPGSFANLNTPEDVQWWLRSKVKRDVT